MLDGILRCHGEAEGRVHLLVEHGVTPGGAGLYGPPAFCNMGQWMKAFKHLSYGTTFIYNVTNLRMGREGRNIAVLHSVRTKSLF